MFKIFFTLISLCIVMTVNAQWQPAGNKIKTKWAEQIDPESVLPEYPRPILKRDQWKNLNGLWDYAIVPKNTQEPTTFDGKILVPFPVESSLSGVMKTVGEDQILWYSTSFGIPTEWNGQNIKLNFGAVDWLAEVWINDIKIGQHQGGYTPFSFDITPYIQPGNQSLKVKVWDPTDKGPQPRGKQVSDPHGIWYTPVTGIWQTVWIEPVAGCHIENLKTTPNLDANQIQFEVVTSTLEKGDYFEVTIMDGSTELGSYKTAVGQIASIQLNHPKLWTPENPFLYRTLVAVFRNGKKMDQVESYFAMRKISTQRDENGIIRMQLNNKDYFHFGPLDQGWWPDGLYTAPSDEALKYDIEKTKDLGFNMIRKHVKVEPARWYTHCDEMGILVWQDMPNGGASPQWQMRQFFDGTEFKRTLESENIYRQEWKDIVDYLYSYPSIVVWVPFNEAWGQFKTEEITDWTRAMDPTRLINSASGGNHYYDVGDILDLHNYPAPELYLYDANRVTVLGEYGGIGLPMEGHLWRPNDNWGYIKFQNKEEVTTEYEKYAKKLQSLVKTGFSAAVYTQTTDVEGEVNGFMTYDRKQDKMIVDRIKKANLDVINALK